MNKIIIALSFFVLARTTLAETLSVATIDMSRILNESTEGKEKKKQLDLLSAAAQKKVEDRRTKVALLEKKVKDSKAAEGSPDFERLRAEAKDYSRFVKDTEEELKKEHMKFTKELLSMSYAAVKKYAEKNKIALVLDKSEKAAGPVLFGNETLDVTDSVLATLKKS